MSFAKVSLFCCRSETSRAHVKIQRTARCGLRWALCVGTAAAQNIHKTLGRLQISFRFKALSLSPDENINC